MIEVKKTIRGPIPTISFEKIMLAVLGRNYELSLVICGDTLAQRMNREYRGKTYIPNVLSFPLSETEGEIFLNVRRAEREAKKYGCRAKERAALLFVHGLLHLKGLLHGRTMESAEQRVLRNFGLSGPGIQK